MDTLAQDLRECALDSCCADARFNHAALIFAGSGNRGVNIKWCFKGIFD